MIQRLKVCFQNAEALREGISLLACDLGIEIVRENADLTVEVCEVEESVSEVTLEGKHAVIRYGGGKARFFRGLARLVGWVEDGVYHRHETEHPLFSSNGAMVDMSRNAVMNVETVTVMLCKMALMGMNTFMLYTEDTYEIEEYPYFGYMRGRYTKEELKYLDGYALALGIELIPCVQMLGHLSTHLRWSAAKPYQDTSNVLLVGAEETYRLIDRMLASISECFTTKRLHIGMDETADLGTGRSLEKNGYRDRRELYFEHMKRVLELTRAYGFRPMMWSDMFFRLAGKDLKGYSDYDVRVEFTDEIVKTIPQGIRQVFWDYYHGDENFYSVNIDKHHALFGEDILFAGGIRTWSGHCPLYSRSLDFTVPALDACRKKGVKEVFATIWHNGSEANLILAIAGLAWYADYDYHGCYDAESVKNCFRYACRGVSYDDLMKFELPEHPEGGKLALTRAFLYNDPLLGLVDKHLEGMELGEYYRHVTGQLAPIVERTGEFKPACETILRLSELLEQKADFGVRLRAAYDAGDAEALNALAGECDTIIQKIRALWEAHRKAWFTYNKPFGWEVHDIRYGGLIARFETTGKRLGEYLGCSISQIEELEEERLRLDGKLEENADPRFHSRFLWMRYQTYATANIL
ncbi:MAG: beta-N-acetylhexosaminidase [Clostridia bacterium]|nr:beta-N-acetylhexosaminidase [Clostridia bacterium]